MLITVVPTSSPDLRIQSNASAPFVDFLSNISMRTSVSTMSIFCVQLS